MLILREAAGAAIVAVVVVGFMAVVAVLVIIEMTAIMVGKGPSCFTKHSGTPEFANGTMAAPSVWMTTAHA